MSRPQNQVGLIVVCQFRTPEYDTESSSSTDPLKQNMSSKHATLPDIIISTTHLKVRYIMDSIDII